MLAELEIENFAIVEKALLSFHHGLNILTGETGAGKSLVVESLNFLMGGSLRDKPLRSGAERCLVSARFVEVDPGVWRKLSEWGFDDEEDTGEILLSREVRSSGRTASRLNGRLVALSNLRELGALLADFHGQHQQYALMRPAVHLAMVDHLAGKAHERNVERYGELYRRHNQVVRELEEIRTGERLRLRELDWTAHEVEEIDKVAPREGEDEELSERIKILAASDELARGCAQILGCLREEGGAGERLGEAIGVLGDLTRRDKRLEPCLQQLRDAQIALEEGASEVLAYSEELVSDPGELDALQTRHEALRKLQSKYGATLAEVLEYRRNAQLKLDKLQNQGALSEQLEAEEKQLLGEMHDLALEISECRRQEAIKMATMVEEELRGVGMLDARFRVDIQQLVEPASDGEDKIEFSICPNPGEPFKPLAKVASGGEISRIMLALTVIFSRYNKVSTAIYDELDAGLGGLAGRDVAARLRDLAQRAQVICVTHLAILAAAGTRHYHMHKRVVEGRTVTLPQLLEGEEREMEIARMLSGDSVPDSARRHARDLLAEGK